MIGILGDFNPEFPTHRELEAELARVQESVAIEWIPTDGGDALGKAASASGLWVIPGTPYKNDDVVYQAIRHARENEQPFLGSCGGFQYALVEFARNVAGISDASHAETSPDNGEHVVHALSCSLIGEEREVHVQATTRLAEICGLESFIGHHYCNYGLADSYKEALAASGLVFNAYADDAGIEGFELPDNRFFIATLFQPQVGALAKKQQHPLIAAFISASN